MDRRCAACGLPAAPGAAFCIECGGRIEEAADAVSSIEARRAALLGQWQRGELSPQAFAAAAAAMRIVDARGVTWQLDVQSGRWLAWDGRSWIAPGIRPQPGPDAASPPGATASTPVAWPHADSRTPPSSPHAVHTAPSCASGPAATVAAASRRSRWPLVAASAAALVVAAVFGVIVLGDGARDDGETRDGIAAAPPEPESPPPAPGPRRDAGTATASPRAADPPPPPPAAPRGTAAGRPPEPAVSAVPPSGTASAGWIDPSTHPVIARAEVGPDGGAVEAAGEIRVEFPAGALTQRESVTLHRVLAGDPNRGVFLVERSGGRGLLARPANVVLRVPRGVDASRTVFLQETAPGLWMSVPSRGDPANGTVTASVVHFCGVAWADLGWKALFGSIAGSVAGAGFETGAIVLSGGSILTGAVTGPPVVIGIIAFGAVANPVYDAYQVRGTDGPLRVDGFDIVWVREDFRGQPHVVVWVDGSGAIVLNAGTAAYDPVILESLSVEHPRGSGRMVRVSSLRRIDLPVAVANAALDMTRTRAWYAAAGYAVCPRICVLVSTRLDSPEPDAPNPGEWDGRILRLNSVLFRPDPRTTPAKQLATLRTTIAHEYWHVIWWHNHWEERQFPGVDECLASTFQNTALPEVAAVDDTRETTEAAVVFAAGLTVRGPHELETAERRGYLLWPFGKYVLHTFGHARIREIAAGTVPPAVLGDMVSGFARSVIAADRRLADPAPLPATGGPSRAVATGWKRMDLDQFRLIRVQALGNIPHPQVRDPRPYSVAALRVDVPPRTRDDVPGDLIVRRMRPDPAEEILVAPRNPDGSARLAPAPSEASLAAGTGAVLVPRAWFDSDRSPVAIPVVLAGRAVGPAVANNPNWLLVYRLTGPREPVAVSVAAESGGQPGVRLSWSPPVPGGGLEVRQCYSGYRVTGRDASGAQRTIAHLPFIGSPPVTASAQPQFPIAWNAAELVLPRTLFDGISEAGIAGVDLVTRDPRTNELRASEPVRMRTLLLSPGHAKIGYGAAAAFVATQEGAPAGAVTWRVREGPAAGSFDATGRFQAANREGLFHIEVTSRTDPKLVATATVEVVAESGALRVAWGPLPDGWRAARWPTSGNATLLPEGQQRSGEAGLQGNPLFENAYLKFLAGRWGEEQGGASVEVYAPVKDSYRDLKEFLSKRFARALRKDGTTGFPVVETTLRGLRAFRWDPRPTGPEKTLVEFGYAVEADAKAGIWVTFNTSVKIGGSPNAASFAKRQEFGRQVAAVVASLRFAGEWQKEK